MDEQQECREKLPGPGSRVPRAGKCPCKLTTRDPAPGTASSMAKVQRIGILTGGGDCPGLNAVIRAAVRTATRDHNLEVLGIQLGFEGLITKSVVPMTGELIRGILPKGG